MEHPKQELPEHAQIPSKTIPAISRRGFVRAIGVVGASAVISGLAPVSQVAAAPSSAIIDGFVGTWEMIHDDWAGTLVIHPPDQLRKAVDGSCVLSYYVIDGTYTGGDGIVRPVRGRIGGSDNNRRTNEACKQSDHVISFVIDSFPGEPPQTFEGYLFTHARRTMSGYTWWHGIPFGWYATKRS